jgi:hypothetical protein
MSTLPEENGSEYAGMDVIKTSMKPPFQRRLLFLLLILCAGGVGRFWGLGGKGLFHFDEGVHVKETMHTNSMMKFWFQATATAVSEKITGRQLWTKAQAVERYNAALNTGSLMTFARPLHIFLAAGLNFFIPSPITAILTLSALLGTLSIIIIYIIGKEMGGDFHGLISAALLSFCGYHLIYSRMAFAEAPSIFFLLLCLLYIVKFIKAPDEKCQKRWALISGLFGGMAFTANYRYGLLLPFAIVGIVLEILFSKKEKSLKILLRFLLYSGVGFLILPIILESYYHAEFLLSRRLNVPFNQDTYFEQCLRQFKTQTFLFGSRRTVQSLFHRLPLEFPYLFWNLTGMSTLLFAVVGSVMILWRRMRGKMLLLLLAYGTLIFYSPFSHREARYFVVNVSLFCLLAATPLTYLAEKIKTPKRPGWISPRLFIALLILCLGEEIVRSVPLIRLHSGYRQAVSYLKSKGIAKHISTQAHITGIYAGISNTATPPANLQELRNLYEKGFRYYLVDAQALIGGFGTGTAEKLEVIKTIQGKLKPVASFPNPSATHFLFWFEHNENMFYTLELIRKIKNSPFARIEIFDLTGMMMETTEPSARPDMVKLQNQRFNLSM